MGNVTLPGSGIKRRVRVDSQHSDYMKLIIADCVAQHLKMVFAVKHGVVVEIVDTDQPGYVIDLNNPAKPFLRNTDATRENNEVFFGRGNIELSSEESIQLIKFGYCDKFSWNHPAKSSSPQPHPPAFLEGKKKLAEYNNVLVTRCSDHENLVIEMQQNLGGLAFDALGFQYRDNPLSDLDQTAMPKDIHKYKMVHGLDALYWIRFLSRFPYLDIMESKWGKSITAFVPGLLYIYRFLRHCYFLDLLPMVATCDVNHLPLDHEPKELYQFYRYCYDVVKMFSDRGDAKHWNESSCDKEVLNKVKSDYKQWNEQLHPQLGGARSLMPGAPPSADNRSKSSAHNSTTSALATKEKSLQSVQSSHSAPVENRKNAETALVSNGVDGSKDKHGKSGEDRSNSASEVEVEIEIPKEKSEPPVGQPVVFQQAPVDSSAVQVPVTNHTPSDEDEVMNDNQQNELKKSTLVPNPLLNSAPVTSDQCNDNTNSPDDRNQNMEIDLPPSADQPDKN